MTIFQLLNVTKLVVKGTCHHATGLAIKERYVTCSSLTCFYLCVQCNLNYFHCPGSRLCHNLNLFLVISPTWRRVPPPDFSDRMPIHIISLRFYYLYLWINRSSHWILAPDDLLHCCGEVPKTSIV